MTLQVSLGVMTYLQMPVALLEGFDDSNVVQDNKLAQVIDLTAKLCIRAVACPLSLSQYGLHQQTWIHALNTFFYKVT